MRTRKPWIRPRAVPTLAFALAAALCWPAAAAGAAQIAGNVVTVNTSAGSIWLASSLLDEAPGDPGRWRFQYELSWDFEPGALGMSSLKILFGGLLSDVAGQTGPAGWVLDSVIATPPFGVGFDLPTGTGPLGTALFSFPVPAGTSWTFEDFGSFAGSHEEGTLVDLVPLVDDDGFGPVVPVPEPGTLALLASGVAVLARLRRR